MQAFVAKFISLLRGKLGAFLAILMISAFVVIALYPFRWNPRQLKQNHAHFKDNRLHLLQPGVAICKQSTDIVDQMIETMDFEIRTVLQPHDTKELLPARIFSVSRSPYHKNLAITQHGTKLQLEIKLNQWWQDPLCFEFPNVFTQYSSYEISVNVSRRRIQLAVNGEHVLDHLLDDEPTSKWNPDYQIAIGNDISGERPWIGVIKSCELSMMNESTELIDPAQLTIPEYFQCGYDKLQDLFENPFQTNSFKIDALLNLICFIPLGFLLSASVFGDRILVPSLFCSAISLVIESLQTYFDGRFPACSDWLLNSIGALIGCLIWKSISRLLPSHNAKAVRLQNDNETMNSTPLTVVVQRDVFDE